MCPVKISGLLQEREEVKQQSLEHVDMKREET